MYLRDPAPETSVKQGKELEALLGDIGCEQTPLVKAGQVINKGPFKFTILSPDEEKLRKLLCVWPTEVTSADTAGAATDYSLSFQDILAADKFEADTSIANGSSIAFIAEADGKAMLFLGDTHDETVLKTLSSMGYSATSKLSVELIKVSHHGSKYNTSPEFLSLINTKRYLISTDGSRHGLPDKRTIARILASSEQGIVLFNYGEVIKRMLLDGESDLYPGRLEALSEGISL